jgi:hypothetical protein
MTVIEGPDESPTSAAPDSPAGRTLQSCWHEVALVQHEMLHSITFADLIKRARAQSGSMYYI